MRLMRIAVPGFFWFLLVVALTLPILLSLEHLQSPPAVLAVLAGGLGLVMIVMGVRAGFKSAPVWWLLVVFVLGLVFLRGVWFGLIQFSGAGFTREFFIHSEWQSVVIAWEEHGRLVRRVLGLLVVVALLVGLGRNLLKVPPGKAAYVLLPLGLVLLVSGRQASPEYELISGWLEWRKPITAQVDEALLTRYSELGLINDQVLPKIRVQASAPDEPRNLVLLYLESVGVNLATQPQWPDLMPNFSRLLDEHGWIEYLWASSYITIEGLTNSMCGTLFPFRLGSDSMAEGDGLADDLPCLGDVLKGAGYHQVYMGGAGMSFAGKGDFLITHGYDEIKGLEYWRSIGLDRRPGTWGLSDADLFDLSITEMQRLRELDQPWNLTLLTIGSHLPGYLYEECDAYSGANDQFLDSLHCTDQLLGRWLERMEAEGLLEDTVIVITADHHIFPNSEMQSLFGDSVFDRRLPLIVIGEDLASVDHPHGAGYDLAPTVLDLLDVRHTGHFILGRSLAKPHTRPDYFVNRYGDVFQGEVVRHADNGCNASDADRMLLPLNACDQRNLIQLLESLVLSVSSPLARVHCSESSGDRVYLPVELEEPFEVVVGGESQAARFTYRSRAVPSTDAGLYSFLLDLNGEVLERRFYPEEHLDDRLQEVGESLAAVEGFMVMIWRPGSSVQVDEGLPLLDIVGSLPDYSVIRVIDADGEVTVELPAVDASAELDLRNLVCES